MSRIYKLIDTACDPFLVIVGDTETEADAQSKWETWRDANLSDAANRATSSVRLFASTLAEDFPMDPWVGLIE